MNSQANTCHDGETIRTFTGLQVCPLNMGLDDICIEDIAHALAMKCRFTGHTRQFYSVAQHCVLMERNRTVYGMAPGVGLLHDAAEAYLPDVAGPIKDRFPTLKGYEKQLECVIFAKFLPKDADREYKPADTDLLMCEMATLMKPMRWAEPSHIIAINPWSWVVAEEEYLKEARCLGLMP